jgi:hypothetical protein
MTFLLIVQYRAKNLRGKEIHSQSMVKVLMVEQANTSKE